MKRKTTASKLNQMIREGIKKACAHLVTLCFRSHSYRIFGIPKGLSSQAILPQNLYGSNELSLQLPKTIDPVLFWPYRKALKSKVHSEEVGVLEVPMGIATALGGNLNQSGELITTYLQSIDGKMAHCHDLFHFSAKRFFPRIYRSRKAVVTLAAGWQGAFYHWLHEVLPRIHLIEKAHYPLEAVFISQDKPFQKQSLELIGLSSETIIDTNAYDAVVTPLLVIPSTPNHPTQWGCQFLRERLLPKLRSLPHARLFISREDAAKRRVLNEKEVYTLLKQYRFTRVKLSSLSLKEQMELFQSAEMVVGPHGAGFSHLVFCQPKTPFLEFFHPGYVNICYWRLCNIMCHPYYYLIGEAKHWPDFVDPHIDPDMTINLKKLEKILNMMLYDFN